MADREGNVLYVPGTSSKAEVKGDEILASYARFTQFDGTVASGQGVLEAGQVMSYVTATKKYVKYAGTTSEVQTLTITGAPTGGAYTLTFSGDETSNIAYNADAAAIQAALEGLDSIDPGDVTVTGTGPFTVTFGGQYMGVNVFAFSVDSTGLTGGSSPSVTVATVTEGGAAAGSGGSETPVGFLRKGVDATSTDMLINVVASGVIDANKAIGLDSLAIAALNGRIDAVSGYFIF